MDFKLELEVSYDIMGRIWQCSMEIYLEEKEAEFVFKYVKFEAIMEHHLIIHLSMVKFIFMFFFVLFYCEKKEKEQVSKIQNSVTYQTYQVAT